ncbi:MAG: hypothetical protein ACLQVI_34545 [Polyangiaceae bacterium]
MNKPLLSWVAAAFAVVSISCGANSAAPGDAGAGDDATVGVGTPLPCDVNAVVVEHCQGCHSNPPQNGAPMPLVSWEDFQAKTPADSLGPQPITGTYVYQTAQFRISDANAIMPQPPNPPLDAADLATMNAWLGAGAPKTDGAVCADDAGVTVPDAATPTVACNSNNVTISPGSAWTMPQNEENVYVCYTATVPVFGDGGTNHVMAITPNIVNHKIVHHVLLFQADPADTSVTTTPQPCNAGGSLTWRIVYGWAPGGGPMQTPPNVGFPYDATTQWIVQVHYNNAAGYSGETDTSGFSFCSTDQPVQYDSDVVAFGTQNINIPAYSTLDQTCKITVPSLFAGIHLFAAFPHMHQIGTAIQSEQAIAGGSSLVGMAQNVPWNFNSQIWFPINATLNEGDVVSTRCAWQNDTSSAVTFGQDTENEMCYSFTAYYPKITTAAWSWALPAIGSSCGPSPDGGLPAPPGGWSTGSGFSGYEDGGTTPDEDSGSPIVDAGTGG